MAYNARAQEAPGPPEERQLRAPSAENVSLDTGDQRSSISNFGSHHDLLCSHFVVDVCMNISERLFCSYCLPLLNCNPLLFSFRARFPTKIHARRGATALLMYEVRVFSLVRV